MAEEIELKLTLAPASLQRLSAHPVFQRLPILRRTASRLRSVYFDTPDRALRNAGISARIRRDGEQAIQTIKAARAPEGLLTERDEWEHPVSGLKLDFSHAEKTALAPFVADAGQRAALKPLFTVEVDRETVTIGYNGSTIEAALDDGRVRAARRVRRFAEVELELKSGNPADLFALARAIAAIVTVRPSSLTKPDRGYNLIDGRQPEVTKSRPVPIEPGTPAGEAFRIIARSCLKQYLANEAVLLRERAPGAVHQARVALRRLRAAISVFRTVVDDRERTFISGELRWMAGRLGDARDIDVYIENVLVPAQAEHAGDPAFTDLVTTYDARRERAYDTARRTLSSRRLARAIIATLAWIEAGAWTRTTAKKAVKRRERPIEKFAAKQLSRRRDKILKSAEDIASLPPEDRHEVRIELKKLRYSAEFFAGLFHDGEARKLLKAEVSAMSKLQDLLGELNDIAVAREREAVSEAEQTLRDEHAAHEQELLAKVERVFATFRESEPFWNAGDDA
ncbi:CYTH and CHAD domain-containing protein [Pseudochelatococcus sp. B33]